MSSYTPPKEKRSATRCPCCQKIHPFKKGMPLKLCAVCELKPKYAPPKEAK